MTNLKDQELVRKGMVEDAINEVRVYPHEETSVEFVAVGDVFAAIDALTPEPVCQDPVSRGEVGKTVTALYNDSHFLGLSVPAAVAVLLREIFKLPSLPVSDRSELEQRIRRAIEYCDQKVGETTGLARTMWQADADLLRAALGEKPRFGKDRSELFQPSEHEAPDYKAMWEELLGREDTSGALRDVMKEIKARHTKDKK